MNFKNKYEEALSRCEYDLEDRIKNDKILMCGRIDIEILKELVDKATPKKPIKLNRPIRYICRKCQLRVYGYEQYQEPPYHFCPHCGQALDWNTND